MSCLTGCTISLEGRTLWQLKSLPVSGRDVFAAKVLLNLLLCAPVSLAVGVLAGVAVGVSGALDWLWLLLTPCAYLVLIVLVGLLGANSIVVLIACALVGLAASKLKIGGMKL